MLFRSTRTDALLPSLRAERSNPGWLASACVTPGLLRSARNDGGWGCNASSSRSPSILSCRRTAPPDPHRHAGLDPASIDPELISFAPGPSPPAMMDAGSGAGMTVGGGGRRSCGLRQVQLGRVWATCPPSHRHAELVSACSEAGRRASASAHASQTHRQRMQHSETSSE